MPVVNDAAEVFAALRQILRKYEKKFVLKHDTEQTYYLETPPLAANKNRPIFFGAVQTMKSYISFHLMPVYVKPELLKNISAELSRQMQGKSCFNFTTVDRPLFRELASLTAAGYEAYEKIGYVGAKAATGGMPLTRSAPAPAKMRAKSAPAPARKNPPSGGRPAARRKSGALSGILALFLPLVLLLAA